MWQLSVLRLSWVDGLVTAFCVCACSPLARCGQTGSVIGVSHGECVHVGCVNWAGREIETHPLTLMFSIIFLQCEREKQPVRVWVWLWLPSVPVHRSVCQGMDEMRGLFVINSFDFSLQCVCFFFWAAKQLLMFPFYPFLVVLWVSFAAFFRPSISEWRTCLYSSTIWEIMEKRVRSK